MALKRLHFINVSQKIAQTSHRIIHTHTNTLMQMKCEDFLAEKFFPVCFHVWYVCISRRVRIYYKIVNYYVQRADKVLDAVWKSGREWVYVMLVCVYNLWMWFYQFSRDIGREREWVKRQDIYNKLYVGLLLLLLLLSSSSSSSIGVCMYIFSAHIWFDSFNLILSHKHTSTLKFIYDCVICIPFLPCRYFWFCCQHFIRHLRNVWENMYVCVCKCCMLATVFTSFLFNKFWMSATRKCVTKQQ